MNQQPEIPLVHPRSINTARVAADPWKHTRYLPVSFIGYHPPFRPFHTTNASSAVFLLRGFALVFALEILVSNFPAPHVGKCS
jgi:hypothetical protein